MLGEKEADATESALVTATDSGLTQAGKAMGTPAYMSPEQAAGKLEMLGPRSDVYSLGATLYCLLTGQPPFTETEVGVVLARTQKGNFASPRQVNAAVPAALEAVCLKAMALAPDERYASPRELADEVERFLADEPVKAHREPFLARAGRWVRKHQTLTAGVGALLLTGVIALGVSTLLVGNAQRATAKALLNEEQARQNLEEVQRQRALDQVNALGVAAPGAVPGILADLQANRADVLPRLRELAGEKGSPDKRMRLALALLPVEPDKVRDELVSWMLQVEDPAEVLLVRDSLKPHAAELKDRLWAKSDDPSRPGERFRALVALAAFDPRNPRWAKAAPGLLSELLTANPLYFGAWVGGLRPVREPLLPPLGDAFRGKTLGEHKLTAARVLADYAADNAALLADLLLEADGRQFEVLAPALKDHRDAVVARMRREMVAVPERPVEEFARRKWPDLPPELKREVEQAGGLLADTFAFAQALPLPRVRPLAESMQRHGYRLLRLRPHTPTEVAALFVRDGRESRFLLDVPAEELMRRDADWQKEGYRPEDVAVLSAGKAIAVWAKLPDRPGRALRFSQPTKEFVAGNTALIKKHHGPHTIHVWPGPKGPLYSSIWGAEPPEDWDLSSEVGESEVPTGVQGFADLCLTPRDEARQLAPEVLGWLAGPWPGLYFAKERPYAVDRRRAYAILQAETAGCESEHLVGLSRDEHLRRSSLLSADGWRMVALSVAGDVVASSWRRLVPAEDVKARLSLRQARAAAVLLRLGEAEEVWPAFRHRPDPTVRSGLLREVGVVGVSAKALVSRLLSEKDTSARRALIVALGEYGEKDLPAQEREPLVKQLLAWYHDDPDAGVHGAIDWLLRHAKEGPLTRPLDWGQRQALEKIDAELAKEPDARARVASEPDAPARDAKDQDPLLARRAQEKDPLLARRAQTTRRWYVNGQGQTYTIIPGPVEFRMGSPPWEANRVPRAEQPHVRRIERTFALQAKAVTVAQWGRFTKERPEVPRDYLKRYSPEADGPIINVSWYTAAKYCNWLSEKEGIPKEQWCYPEEIDERKGLKPYPDYLKRTGYRLPTEAEWEHACRAEAVTSRYFGSALELLPRYALFQKNAEDRAWPSGQKRPNDLGLFDLHGNTWCWCQDGGFYYPRRGKFSLDRENIRDINSGNSRVLRGAAFSNLAPDVRSAARYVCRPDARFITAGLRPARTYP